MGDRLLARVIDAFVLLPVWIVIAVMAASSDQNGARDGVQLLGAVIGAVYEIAFISQRGATVGKRAMGVKVVRRVDGQLPGPGIAIGRYFAFVVMVSVGALALLVGAIVVLLSPLFDKTGARQGWWDKVAGTVVIKSR
jgi:uncharacterized RDD family membrane protein YckC